MLTVTDEAPSPDLATLATVKAGLGITDSSEDATLPPLIRAASAAIAAACNRVLVEEGLQETIRSNHADLGILLSRYPVTEVTEVVERLTTLQTTDFEVDPASGYVSRLRSGCEDWWSPGTITINYVAGYSLQTMPADLVQALIMLVSHYRSSAARDPLLRAEGTTDIERLEYFIPTAGGLPPAVEALLASHRKPAGC
jgi:uncharacterized phiE125 gp8 family phage protein